MRLHRLALAACFMLGMAGTAFAQGQSFTNFILGAPPAPLPLAATDRIPVVLNNAPYPSYTAYVLASDLGSATINLTFDHGLVSTPSDPYTGGTGEATLAQIATGTVLGNFSGILGYPVPTVLTCAYISDAGAGCSGSGGSSPSITALTPDIVITPTPCDNTQSACTIGSIQPISVEPGGSYTFQSTDATKLVFRSYPSGAQTDSIPAAGGTGFGAGFAMTIQTGSNGDTITPVAGTINGAAVEKLGAQQGAYLVSALPNQWLAFLGLPQPATQTGSTILFDDMVWRTLSISVLADIPARTILGNTTGVTGPVTATWLPTGDQNNVGTVSGSLVNGNCIQADGNGNLVDAGAPCGGGGGGGSVTSVGLGVPAASLFGVTGSPITTAGVLGLTTSGTSGGIPYFSSTTQMNSSGLLAAHNVVIGGGAGTAPSGVAGGTGCVLAWSVSSSDPTCTATPTLGASGTIGSLAFGNATSGTVTLSAATGALGSATAKFSAGATFIPIIPQVITVSGPTAARTWTAADASFSIAALDIASQVVTGGFIVTPANLGTISSGTTTVNCGTRDLQYFTNGGAFTLAAPANDGTCALLMTNNGTAGAITLSGFTTPGGGAQCVGTTLDTTDTHQFKIYITRINGVSDCTVQAYQ